LRGVADSSLLIALSAIGQLELLPQRFSGGVIVPHAVWREVVETGRGRTGAAEVASVSWITVCGVQDKNLVSLLRSELDEGEAEAVALCREQGAEVVLLDEKAARRVARRLGLAVLGTVGVLIWAKRAGLVASLRQELDALHTRGGFHLGESVYEEALRVAGEIEL
jgi:predicted nucleic acid-binding protein